MPKQRSTVACQHSQIRRRGNQGKLADFFIKGRIVFKNGVVEPGGDYTLIREEIARQYGVPVEDVTVEVTSGSVIINYNIRYIFSKGYVVPDINMLTRALAYVFIANPTVTKVAFSGFSAPGYADSVLVWALYANGNNVTIPAALPCSINFSDIFNQSGYLKNTNYIFPECYLLLTASVTIQQGESLTIPKNAIIETDRFTITNYGIIKNYGIIGISLTGQFTNYNSLQSDGLIVNDGVIINYKTINSYKTINTGKILNEVGTFLTKSELNNYGTIYNKYIFDNTGGTINNYDLFININSILNNNGNFFNNSIFMNYVEIENNAGRIGNNAGGIIVNYNNFQTGGIVTNSSNAAIYDTRQISDIFPVNNLGVVIANIARYSDIFNDSGTLKQQNYVLPTNTGLQLTGDVTIQSGDFLSLSAGSFIYTDGFSINNAGLISIDNGATLFNGSLIGVAPTRKNEIVTTGQIDNKGTIVNLQGFNIISNKGTITNYDVGKIYNNGVIICQGLSNTQDQSAVIVTYGKILNNGIIKMLTNNSFYTIGAGGTIDPNAVRLYCKTSDEMVNFSAGKAFLLVDTTYVEPFCTLNMPYDITIGGGTTRQQLLQFKTGSNLITNGHRLIIGSIGKIVVEDGVTINIDGTHRIDDQEEFAQAGLLGHGVEARCGFNNASCTVHDGRIYSIQFTSYLNSRGTGTSITDGTNSPVVTIYNDTINLNHTRTYMGAHDMTFVPPGLTSVTIILEGNASNNWGDQAYARKSWTYKIAQLGISGP
jgi:hypothetical protein